MHRKCGGQGDGSRCGSDGFSRSSAVEISASCETIRPGVADAIGLATNMASIHRREEGWLRWRGDGSGEEGGEEREEGMGVRESRRRLDC